MRPGQIIETQPGTEVTWNAGGTGWNTADARPITPTTADGTPITVELTYTEPDTADQDRFVEDGDDDA